MMFEKINPFVRHTSIIRVNPTPDADVFLKSYDNCMIYMISGECAVEVDGQSFELARGDIVLWRAGMPYRVISASSNASCVLTHFDYVTRIREAFNILIQPVPNEEFDESKITDTSSFDDVPILNDCLCCKSMHLLDAMFMEMHSDFKMKKNNLNIRLKSRMSIILCEILHAGNFRKKNKAQSTVDHIIRYIDENCTDSDLTNEEISVHFGFHPQHINRIMRQKTGYSLHKFIQIKRIQKAVDYLLKTDLEISAVAVKAGFNDVYHFSRYFKQIMGLSPKKYRDSNRK